MHDTMLKICVVGPCNSGKTLLSKLIGQQLLNCSTETYHATKALRIQEATVIVDLERVSLQLWDCSGDLQYQKYWNVLAQDLDGLLIVYSSAGTDWEMIEKLHKDFTTNCSHQTPVPCLLLSLQISQSNETPRQSSSGNVTSSKLASLKSVHCTISPSDQTASAQILLENLHPFFKECSEKRASSSLNVNA